MKFTLIIETDNADFTDSEDNEALFVALRRVADRVRYGTEYDQGGILDTNSNRVGEWDLT